MAANRQPARLWSWETRLAEVIERRVEDQAPAPRSLLAVYLDRFVVDGVDHAMEEILRGSAVAARAPTIVTRSVPVETLLRAQLSELAARREAPGSPTTRREDGMAPGGVRWTGLGAVAKGLVLRTFSADGERLRAVELLLPDDLLADVDAKLTATVRAQVAPQEREAWWGEGFEDLRTAFVEAGLRSWLVERRAVRQCEGRHRA